MVFRSLLAPIYFLLERSGGYAIGQWIGRPTIHRFRELFRENIVMSHEERVLDLGCGIGGYRDCFAGQYHGIDINPDYIADARRRLDGTFEVMDCNELRFAEGSFHHVVSIATTHHLSDEELQRTLKEALRVCAPSGSVHVIDAVLPMTSGQYLKYLYFRADRGRYPRYLERLVEVAGAVCRIACVKTMTGPLHDVCYLRLTKQADERKLAA
jgi:ubiquinone/menaquinone biosynthesis C-methylase UbiE